MLGLRRRREARRRRQLSEVEGFHHRLAGQASVAADALRDEPWVAGSAEARSTLLGAWTGSAWEPTIAYVARDWNAKLGLVAAGLAAYALVGLYADKGAAVHTPRGTFVTTAAAAPALTKAVAAVDAQTRPGQPILAGPADGGLYFMTGRPPALHELMLLPGLLDSRADEVASIARLRAARVGTAVIGARDFSAWGWKSFGTDYNRALGDALRRATVSSEVVGRLSDPAAGTNPSTGFTVARLRW